ncbi:flagellar basal body rod protein FlgB [Vibrio barjaei]|uniref:flagellar basal body rod protein FlgB n=1 Tax=Vibrio barjaei TaxID=1676683 RepID=UPI0022844C70|nr:flagellar basal body rod protein FlgB [Vibrio barjaei]MCY9872320.1 flagellar basal body rod protein FlgB [Vibrio barjaei]
MNSNQQSHGGTNLIKDDVFGVLPAMMDFRASRAEILSTNIAHADTPNFKAKDLTFEVAMRTVNQNLTIEQNQMYRNPMQRSRDGNTVEMHVEQAKFAENTMRYNQSVQFFKSKVSGIKQAIEGR